MNDEDIKKLRIVIKEEVASVVSEELKPIKKTLDAHTQKLDALWDQTVKLTEDLEEVKISDENMETRFDQIDRKLDIFSDKVSQHGVRLDKIESVFAL